MDILRWRRFPPATSRISRWKCAVLTVRSGVPECLSTQPAYHKGARESNQRVPPSANGAVFLPGLKARGFQRRFL